MTRIWMLEIDLKMEQRFGALIGDRSLVCLMPSSTRAGWALVLAGVVFLGSGLLPGQAAIAQTHASNPPLTQPSFQSGLLANAAASTTHPPTALVNTLRQDLSKRTGIAANKLRFTQSSKQTWSDGCLGLAQPGQMCTQAMVSGWRITFANGSRRWNYRTDATGRVYRLEA